MELDAVIAPFTPYPLPKVTEDISAYKAIFEQMGLEEGKSGAPMQPGPDASIFKAHQYGLAHELRKATAARKAVAESNFKAHQTHLEERQVRKSQAEELLSSRSIELGLPSKISWMYWILATTAIVGEFPLAFQMFDYLLGGKDIFAASTDTKKLIAVLGAIGIIGSTASVKVILDWLMNRLARNGEYREKSPNLINKLILLAVILVGCWLFASFAQSVGQYRSDLEASRAMENLVDLARDSAGEAEVTGSPSEVQMPSEADQKEIASRVEQSITYFFIRFGLLFPFSAAVLVMEAEARGRRRRARSKIMNQLKKIEAEIPSLDAAQSSANNILATATIHHEYAMDESLGDAWRHQFWSAYHHGYLKGMYDPERIEKGPGLFEKVEALRLKSNQNPILS